MTTTNEEYLNQRKKEVVEIAQQILKQSLSVVDGSVRLSTLRLDVCDDPADEDFRLFVAIESESDHLPLKEVRKKYSEQALEKADTEIEEIEKIYRGQIQTACKKLIERFGNAG